MILLAIGIISTIIKLADPSRFGLSMEYFGPALAYTDYLIDAVFLGLSLAVEYGLYKGEKWAWKAVFFVYGVYLAGSVFGFVVGYFMFDQAMAFASMLKYGEVVHQTVPIGMYVGVGVSILLVNCIIAFFILRIHYNHKDYFQK